MNPRSVDVADAAPLKITTSPRRFHTAAGRGRVYALLPWLPAGAALLTIAILLLVVGTSAVDIARYAVYAAWGLVLPGTLVYRSLRRASHSLVDDLAMGTVVGLALEIAAWTIFSSIGAQQLLLIWPLAVVIIFVAFPRLRRHWHLSAGTHRPSLGWSWAVAAVAVAAAAYIIFASMWVNSAIPTGTGSWYHIDLVYLLSIVGDAKHHFPIASPGVGSDPLNYHFFTFAHGASASLMSGVDTPVVFFRLDLPLLAGLSAVTLAIAAWRVSGKPWVGVLSAALMFVVGESTLDPQSGSGMGSAYAYYSWSSPSLTYSFPITFAIMATVVDLLRRDGSTIRHRLGEWTLFAGLSLAAAGAKSTVLPVVAAGLGVAALAQLVTRRRIGAELFLMAGVVGAASLFAVAVLFRFESHGLSFEPLAPLARAGVADRSWRRQAFVLAGVMATYAFYMLPRLAGLPVLARLNGRGWKSPEWFLLGSFLGGFLGTILLNHTAWGQNYFVSSGFAFGAVLSAMGFVALVERHQLRTNTVVAILTGMGLLIFVAVPVIRDFQRLRNRVESLRLPGTPSVMTLAVLFLIALCLGAVAWFMIMRGRVRRGVGAVTALAAFLMVGLPTYSLDAHWLIHTRSNWGYQQLITQQESDAARWLRSNSSPNDMVAINDHCMPVGGSDICYELIFWLNAFGERRTLAGSSNYGRTTAVAQRWDHLLAENDAVFYQPTADSVKKFRTTYGVRWLTVNRAVKRESPALSQFATLRYENSQVAIYELT